MQKMAIKSVFAFVVLSLFTYCEAKPENCKLLPVGGGLVSEFHHKASQKGVRLVYLNLKIGNVSYDPLELQDVFLPHRWVWANTITEPMLSLLDDYDILSLGLLNYQVRSMDVHLEDQPRGCLANLNPTYKNLAVGGMLLENVTIGSSDELSDETRVVCVAFVNRSKDAHQHINYHCCGMHKGPNGPSILCDLTFDGRWFTGFDGIINILWILMSLFLPALPLALPDCVFSLRRECDKDNRSESSEQPTNVVVPSSEQNNNGTADQQSNQAINSEQDSSGYIRNGNEQSVEESEMIPVDDASPVTFSTLLLDCAQKMPDVGLSFNIKLFLVYVCVFPCFIYLQLGIYNTFKKTHINESFKKGIPLGKVFTKHVHWSVFVTFGAKEIAWIFTLTFTSLAIVLSLKPEDLYLKPGIYCPICIGENDNKGPSRHSLGHEMRLHFEKLRNCLCDLILHFAKLVTSEKFLGPCEKLRPCKNRRQASRTMHLIYHARVLLHSMSVLFTLLLRVLCGAICFPFYLVFFLSLVGWYSPLFFILGFYVINGSRLGQSDVEDANHRITGSSIVVSTLLSFSFCYTLIIVTVVTCGFINKALGYIIAGLLLNDYVVTPYVAFVLVVTTNIYLCYASMQEKYMEVKGMTFKWQKELEINSNDPEGTIRAQLFRFVCEEVLPIESEICLMFRNMVLILLFLFLVVYSIVVFGNEYKASAVFSTFYVFVGGLIPAIVFEGLTKRNKFIGWEKIRIEREIERAVKKFSGIESVLSNTDSDTNNGAVSSGSVQTLKA